MLLVATVSLENAVKLSLISSKQCETDIEFALKDWDNMNS